MEREEAIEVVKKNWPDSGYSNLREALETLIPELKESEDERIRKWIIDELKDSLHGIEAMYSGDYDNRDEQDKERQAYLNKALTYLERQKEQKSLNISAASEWMRKHVCKYVNSEYNEFHKCVEYDGSIDKERLVSDFEEAMQKDPNLSTPEDIAAAYQMGLAKGRNEQKPAEKQDYSGLSDLERAILRGFLSAGVENVPVGIIKETAKECLAQMKPEEWGDEDELMRTTVIQTLERFGGCGTTGMQIDWLKFLRPQPKAELTLLDKNIIAAAVAFVEQNDHFNCWGGIDKHTVIKALRSLKPHWKPSEEQMRFLLAVINDPNNACAESCHLMLQSLYADLQKLL